MSGSHVRRPRPRGPEGSYHTCVYHLKCSFQGVTPNYHHVGSIALRDPWSRVVAGQARCCATRPTSWALQAPRISGMHQHEAIHEARFRASETPWLHDGHLYKPKVSSPRHAREFRDELSDFHRINPLPAAFSRWLSLWFEGARSYPIPSCRHPKPYIKRHNKAAARRL